MATKSAIKIRHTQTKQEAKKRKKPQSENKRALLTAPKKSNQSCESHNNIKKKSPPSNGSTEKRGIRTCVDNGTIRIPTATRHRLIKTIFLNITILRKRSRGNHHPDNGCRNDNQERYLFHSLPRGFYQSTKLLSFFARLGCRSLRSAFASI